jgi:uncharacterized protein YbjT (DUF2867 family)
MSTILVTGGSGVLGSLVVPLLSDAGHDVRVLSRRPGAGTHTGDLATGAGVDEATDGTDVIVHCASDTRHFGRQDVEQTRTLVEAAAGSAEHIVYISIVGIDSIPLYYYVRKLACEGVIATSGIPYTIFRATQFHQLIEYLLNGVRRLPVAPLPLDFRFQPVAAREAAARLAELVEAGPAGGRAPDMGGPEVHTLSELAATWQAAGLPPRKIVRLPVPGRVGDAFRRGLNTCPDLATGVETWAEFVASRQ